MKIVFLSYIDYWVQLRSLHLKKDVVKSEDTEKGNENDSEVKQPIYVERPKRVLSSEARRLRGYVQSSPSHKGDG